MSNALDKQQVGLQGFLCPRDHQKKPFDFCFLECKDHCEPLPVLLALSSARTVEENVYSVTEILNPPQVVHLNRTTPYYDYPKNMIWRTFGTGWHSVFEGQKGRLKELGLSDDYVIENNGESFRVEIPTSSGTAILRGTPDLYVKSKKELWDFKTSKYYYTLQNIWEKGNWEGETYHLQVNIYRVYCFPEAEKMILEALVKDWSRKLRKKVGIDPIVQVDLPFIHDEVIKNIVKAKLTYLLECQADPSKIRDCTLDEVWFQKNPKSDDYQKPLRCQEYCPPCEHCKQYQAWKERYGSK